MPKVSVDFGEIGAMSSNKKLSLFLPKNSRKAKKEAGTLENAVEFELAAKNVALD